MTKKLDSLEVLDNLVTEIYNYQNNAIKNTQKLSDAIKVLHKILEAEASMVSEARKMTLGEKK